MDTAWPYEFRERMRRFEGGRRPRSGEAAVSIKVRVPSGCFHREHSPNAFDFIDQSLKRLAAPETEVVFQEHETGPEVLTYVALTAAGLSLTAAVINLVTAIINARSKGIGKGDHPTAPLHLIVRRVHETQGFHDEQVLTIGPEDAVDQAKIEAHLTAALRKLLKEGSPPEGKGKKPHLSKHTASRGQKKAKNPSRRKSER
jgi:hypothetical protein